jgi:hypothetical protein
LVLDVVALPPIAIEDVQWARDGPKFACKGDGCNASYMAKYNSIQHLQVCHNVVMELGKPGCPSTREEGPRHQNHIAMNVWVLNNLLAWFCHNEQKVVARAKKHINLEWGRFRVAWWDTPMVPKPIFVKLTSSHIF